jgi:hypothetical protein
LPSAAPASSFSTRRCGGFTPFPACDRRFVADLPLSGSTDTESFHIVGRPDPSPDRGFNAGFNIVSAGYFQLMAIPIRSGREFLGIDGPQARRVIVNETAAQRFGPAGRRSASRSICRSPIRNPLF